MILNELSVHGNIKEREEINSIISQFLKICNKIFREKGDMDFYYAEELMTGELTTGYTIHDWLQDSHVSHQEKAFFRTIINRKQLIQESDFLESELLVELGEHKKTKAMGCLAAYEWESFVVSMNTAPIWAEAEIKGSYVSLEEEDRRVSIENCCLEEHVARLSEKEKSRLISMVSSGKELWEKREMLYPHLQFCNSVKKQLEEARLSLHIKMIMKRLQILEDYLKNFNGQFEKDKVGYGCRSESESVENNTELRSLRTFRTPYGKEEFFSWHISFAGDFPGRIHFIPDAEHKVGIVGYIGKHLPTGKFPII